MREDKEVRAKAALLIRKMQGRAEQIVALSSALAQRDAGLSVDVGPDRAVTMQRQLAVLTQRQGQEAIELACMRWVLGVTETIDPDYLGLEKQ